MRLLGRLPVHPKHSADSDGRKQQHGQTDEQWAPVFLEPVQLMLQSTEQMGFINFSHPKEKLREETVKLAKKLMEKSPAAMRYTKEAIRAVRFMNEPQAADYLNAKSDALRFVDKEDSRTQGMKQFLDDKSYRPGLGAFKRQKRA